MGWFFLLHSRFTRYENSITLEMCRNSLKTNFLREPSLLKGTKTKNYLEKKPSDQLSYIDCMIYSIFNSLPFNSCSTYSFIDRVNFVSYSEDFFFWEREKKNCDPNVIWVFVSHNMVSLRVSKVRLHLCACCCVDPEL